MSIWPPETFQDAKDRLPKRNHPLYKTDLSIEHLAHYRNWLNTEINNPDPFFRIFPLTRDELNLMEQTSFIRDPKRFLLFPNALINENSMWYPLIGREEKTSWRISLAKPQPEVGLIDRRLIFIETDVIFPNDNPYLIEWKSERQEFYLAMTEIPELTLLMATLSEGKGHTEGDIGDFLPKENVQLLNNHFNN